jgi:hypothetical protein
VSIDQDRLDQGQNVSCRHRRQLDRAQLCSQEGTGAHQS